MEQKSTPESAVREIRRKTRRKFFSEENIKIVLEDLRAEESIAELCRRERVRVCGSVSIAGMVVNKAHFPDPRRWQIALYRSQTKRLKSVD